MTLAATGQTTVGVTDVGGFAGLLRGELVLGGTVVTSVGPVGLNSDVAVTFPKADDQDPFACAVLGALGRPGAKRM